MPIDDRTRLVGFRADAQAAQKPYRLSWRTRRPPPGRGVTIENQPVQTGKGLKTWSPLQVACMAYQAGYSRFDFIHVHTPVLESGDRGIENLYFPMDKLRKMDTTDPDFFPKVEKGVITLEAEAVNEMPGRYEITDAGLFVPTVRS